MKNIDAKAIYDAELAAYGDPAAARMGARTRIHALLHEARPAPQAHDVAHKPAPVVNIGTLQGSAALGGGAPRAPVTHAPVDHHTHAHQVAHHADLWAETDRLLAAAGV